MDFTESILFENMIQFAVKGTANMQILLLQNTAAKVYTSSGIMVAGNGINRNAHLLHASQKFIQELYRFHGWNGFIV